MNMLLDIGNYGLQDSGLDWSALSGALAKGIVVAVGLIFFFVVSILLLVGSIILAIGQGLKASSLQVALASFIRLLFLLLSVVFGVVFFAIAFVIFHVKISILYILLLAVGLGLLIAYLFTSAARLALFALLGRFKIVQVIVNDLNRIAELIQQYVKK